MFREFNIKKIVVPTDFSETANVAIQHAVELAKRFEAEITFVHVIESGAYQGIFSPKMITGETSKKEQDEAQHKLEQDAAKCHKDTGIKVKAVVVSGRIYEEVINVSQEAEADIIVMGTHGVSGWTEFFVGSNAFKVVTQSPCPICTVQASAPTDGYKNIILPIDGSLESRQKVRYAAAIAKKYDATVHIGVLIQDDDPEVRFEFDIKIKQITNYLEAEEIAYTTNTLVGSNLATMTMNFAESKAGDMIVMMTEQESNLTGFLMGPYAQQIVNHSRIPVLSISPEEGEGFHLT